MNRLNYLYLLTVADIRATSPDVWNTWKDALLKELYNATKQALRRGLDNPILDAENIAATKASALAMLLEQDITQAQVAPLWERFGNDYFLRYQPEEVVWHTELLLKAEAADLPIVMSKPAEHRGGNAIFIYTQVHDRNFAQITATIEQLGLTIMDAKIMYSRDDFTLDTFVILDETGEMITDNKRLQDIAARLKTRLQTPEAALPEPAQHLARQAKAFRIETKVQFWQDDKNERTAMQVTTYDRPGLLSRIARALLDCGVMLQNAKIATFGERAEDIFYITNSNNQQINTDTEQDAIRQALLTHL